MPPIPNPDHYQMSRQELLDLPHETEVVITSTGRRFNYKIQAIDAETYLPDRDDEPQTLFVKVKDTEGTEIWLELEGIAEMWHQAFNG